VLGSLAQLNNAASGTTGVENNRNIAATVHPSAPFRRQRKAAVTGTTSRRRVRMFSFTPSSLLSAPATSSPHRGSRHGPSQRAQQRHRAAHLREAAPSRVVRDQASQEYRSELTLASAKFRRHVGRRVAGSVRELRGRHQREGAKASSVVVSAVAGLAWLERVVVSRAAATLADPRKVATASHDWRGATSSRSLSSHDRAQASQRDPPSHAAGHFRVHVRGTPAYPPVAR